MAAAMNLTLYQQGAVATDSGEQWQGMLSGVPAHWRLQVLGPSVLL